MTKLWGDSRFVFSVDVSPDIRVLGDRNLLETALFNLLDNAVKSGTGEGEILLEAMMDDKVVQIDVINSIVPDRLQSTHGLLDRNALGGGNSRGIHGTGIGLHLVPQIVTRHHGDVSMVILKPDRVRARVRLPLLLIDSRNTSLFREV